MTRIESVTFDVTSYKPSQQLSRLLDDLAKSANTLVMHIAEVGIILNEIVSQGRKDGLLDIQIRELIDLVLGENRTIRKYLPKELKKHNYPEQRKRIEEIGTGSNVDSNSLIEYVSAVESVEEIQRSGELENSLAEREWQDNQVLHQKIEEREQLIIDLKKMLEGKDELIAELESKLISEAQQTPEFQKAKRQIEIAYEDQISLWKSEYEKVNKKFQEINQLQKIVEFSPSRLKCLDLIFEHRDGILYLEHDGIRVIKVTPVKPIEHGGKIVN